MIGYLWFGIILVSILSGIYNNTLDAVVSQVSISAEKSFMLAIKLGGIMTLWLGIMKIAEDAGLVQAISNTARPILQKLFPSIPKEHPALGAIALNISANMLGLNNAATPLGIKAMQELESLNPEPSRASDDMCMLLAINTSSIQLMPTTVIGILATFGSAQPTAIILSSILATTVSTLVAIITAKQLARIYK